MSSVSCRCRSCLKCVPHRHSGHEEEEGVHRVLTGLTIERGAAPGLALADLCAAHHTFVPPLTWHHSIGPLRATLAPRINMAPPRACGA